MPYILKNNKIEIEIDLPDENYHFSRFDWTGKIVGVTFKNIPLSGLESTDCQKEHYIGKGFYNEFGIDSALGFDETAIGEWFHKIGVGLLKKEDNQYLFSKKYKIKPAEFIINFESNSLLVSCKSDMIHGYAYLLKKEIKLQDNGFTIKYYLENTGEKDIVTDEYVHNFTVINKEPIGSNYRLKFPFQLKPSLFTDTINPENKVEIGKNDMKFMGPPKEEFFFSNLTGNANVDAQWELINIESNIGIIEAGSFQTNKVNLWGTKHVISPELFFKISIEPGQSTEWSRNYTFYKLR